MTTATATATGTYAIDPTHSRIGFVARHAMVTKVRGSFNEFEGTGVFDAEDPTRSSLQLTIKTASIDTRNADRDGHLRGNDFFAMDEYPEIRFESTAAEKVDDTNYRLTGDLTIKGVTKPITVQLQKLGEGKDPRGTPRIGFETRFTINRSEYGVSGLPGGVGEQIPLIVAIEATGAK